MNGFEKQRFDAELRAAGRRLMRRGEIQPYLFYWRFVCMGKQWHVMGDRVNEWHWFDTCLDVFPEGTIYRVWIAKVMLKVRFTQNA